MTILEELNLPAVYFCRCKSFQVVALGICVIVEHFFSTGLKSLVQQVQTLTVTLNLYEQNDRKTSMI